MDKFIKTVKKIGDYLAVGGVNQKDIVSAEQELNLKFSREYKVYLKEFGQLIVDGHEFTGIHNSDRLNVVKVTSKFRKKYPNIPADWYVVEDLAIDGIVIWQTEKGTVYEMNAEGNTANAADTLAEYLLQ